MDNSAINGRARPTSPAVGTGSATQTQPATRQPRVHATLRLRGAAPSSRDRHIQWDESVIDNEGMGKKSSKVCCIYHKPRAAGESSSEEDSDSSSSSSDSDNSDSEPDTSRAMPAGGGGARSRGRRRHHHHGHGDDDHDGCGGPGHNKGKDKQRDYSPNAYERMPKYKTSSSAAQKP
ncbi:hypothetical protein L228DRAFT_236630 [Xylona heveae TC161]|uniref:Type 1 phosphatases regulator n=1 Tax=Xylona heveae (strain CBS 132557 / TC161) TaxID=1328760 RepID=A0A165IYE6_XYLHT|nr:hypothetical protein L228DRAFT_236630 [Xylona heveae TC161]KZF25548.1 hypothetical protein L228DRAFT_236630 [Xylona heveae TC161]